MYPLSCRVSAVHTLVAANATKRNTVDEECKAVSLSCYLLLLFKLECNWHSGDISYRFCMSGGNRITIGTRSRTKLLPTVFVSVIVAQNLGLTTMTVQSASPSDTEAIAPWKQEWGFPVA